MKCLRCSEFEASRSRFRSQASAWYPRSSGASASPSSRLGKLGKNATPRSVVRQSVDEVVACLHPQL